VTEAVLALVPGILAGEVAGHGALHRRDVIGMNEVVPRLDRRRRELLESVADQLRPAFVEDRLPRVYPPLPRPEARTGHGVMQVLPVAGQGGVVAGGEVGSRYLEEQIEVRCGGRGGIGMVRGSDAEERRNGNTVDDRARPFHPVRPELAPYHLPESVAKGIGHVLPDGKCTVRYRPVCPGEENRPQRVPLVQRNPRRSGDLQRVGRPGNGDGTRPDKTTFPAETDRQLRHHANEPLDRGGGG